MNERRFDATTAQWVTFAAHRQDRTFLPSAERCPLCPSLDPAIPTEVPHDRFDVAVFENRFPSFVPEPPAPLTSGTDTFAVAPAAGAAEVVVYSPRHDLSMSSMSTVAIRNIIEVWADRYAVLGARPEIDYVFVFENRGEQTGVTLHHPHGQIYGYPEIPPIPKRELEATHARLEQDGNCLFCEQVGLERSDGVRVVAANQSFMAFVPFAARFPYEIRISSRRHASSLLCLTDPERDALADMLLRVLRSYDALFEFPLPYVMAIHQAPTATGSWLALSHFHIELYPPHRAADRLKYLAGSELGAGAFLNDVAPERAAAALRTALTRAS